MSHSESNLFDFGRSVAKSINDFLALSNGDGRHQNSLKHQVQEFYNFINTYPVSNVEKQNLKAAIKATLGDKLTDGTNKRNLSLTDAIDKKSTSSNPGNTFDIIKNQRNRLRVYTEQAPNRWIGSLRRSTFARAIQGSNSIEGYNASIEDAIAVIENEQPVDAVSETWSAIKGYRDALTYIMQAAKDPYFEFSKQFLKSLHFMMIGFDMTKHPGQWRPGSIFIVEQSSGKTVYEAPPAETVDSLIQELVEFLKTERTTPDLVRAALAHLNLTMIHPFKDGNGRMARALQTFILAQDGILHPLFSSIEEWLGRNTQAYYSILAEVGQGKWNPRHDSLPWVRFCLNAHYQQAALLLRRNEEYSRVYEKIAGIIKAEKLPERMEIPLFDATLGFRTTNSRYRKDADVSEFVASRDLKRLCELNLLSPKGEKRGRTYAATKKLNNLRDSVRINTVIENVYMLAKTKAAAQSKEELPQG